MQEVVRRNVGTLINAVAELLRQQYIEKLKNVSTDIVKIPESWSDKILWAIRNILDDLSKVPAEFFTVLWRELMETKIPSLVNKISPIFDVFLFCYCIIGWY